MGADGGALVDRLLLDPDPAYASVIDRGAVERAVSEWRSGRAANANLLLGLVMLEVWMGQYLPRAMAAGPVALAA